MLTKRIIPCLDVCNGKVVKGVKFQNLEVIGEILDLAGFYTEQGADELVFYDITASVEERSVSTDWIESIAKVINIPFCVAGGIRSVDQAKKALYAGADKISINTPAIDNPQLIEDLALVFGSQCVVVGIDSKWINDDWYIHSHSGSATLTQTKKLKTLDWIQEVQNRGAGEIVLNCMNSDGTREGYDLPQLIAAKKYCKVPLIASGGAGKKEDFAEVFKSTHVDGALAASIFHKKLLLIPTLKAYLQSQNILTRI